MTNILDQLDNLDPTNLEAKPTPKPHFNVVMQEDYKGLKKGEIIDCFLENEDAFLFDYAWEHDTEVWEIPKALAIIVEETKTEAPANPFGVKILIYSEIDGIRQEVLTAHLRGTKPFTAEMVDAFINWDQMLATIRKGMENDSIEMKVFWLISNA